MDSHGDRLKRLNEFRAPRGTQVMLTVICNSKQLPLLLESPSAFCSTDQDAYEQLVADLYGAIGKIAPPTFASTMCRVEGVPSSGQRTLLLQAYSSPLDKEDQSEEECPSGEPA